MKTSLLTKVALLTLISTLWLGQAHAADEILPPTVKSETYTIDEGVISYTKLAAFVSGRIGQTVTIDDVRWSHNPFDAVFWAVQLGTVKYYVVEFTIAPQHQTQCWLMLNTESQEFRIDNCVSNTAKVHLSVISDYAQIFDSIAKPRISKR